MGARRVGLFLLLAAVLLSACASSASPIRKVGGLKGGPGYDLFVQGDYAYVANNDGVLILDIRDRSRPKKLGLIDMGEIGEGVYVEGNLAYVGGGGKSFVVADVSDPVRPRVLGEYGGGVVVSLCVQGSIAYAGYLHGELRIINVEDPARPVLQGRYADQGMGADVACRGDIVYFAIAEKGLQVIDVSDPALPIRLTTVANTRGAKDIQIVGDRLYLGCHGAGARILDISDPRAPRVLATFSRTGEAWGVAGDSARLWVADLQEGVELYDVSNAGNPRLLAHSAAYAPHDIFFDGRYAYLADQDKHFVILEYVAESQ